jgi:hypothetical protein
MNTEIKDGKRFALPRNHKVSLKVYFDEVLKEAGFQPARWKGRYEAYGIVVLVNEDYCPNHDDLSISIKTYKEACPEQALKYEVIDPSDLQMCGNALLDSIRVVWAQEVQSP